MYKQWNTVPSHLAGSYWPKRRALFLIIFLFMMIVSTRFSGAADEATEVVIKLNVIASINNGKLQVAQGSKVVDLQEIECIIERHDAVIYNTFSTEPGSLNDNGQLSNYLTISFINGLNQGVSISQVIDDLKRLDFVQTAYLSPVGEDAEAPLPED